MGVHEHKKAALDNIRCAVVTISDTRTLDDDESGKLIAARLADAGHVVARRELVTDDASAVSGLFSELASDGGIDAVISNGGTGLGGRDNTYEAVSALLVKRLDGFGELFRRLSYDDIGSAAMLSRAVAGSIGGTAVFCLPGSPAACALGMDDLILPELGHVVKVMRS